MDDIEDLEHPDKWSEKDKKQIVASFRKSSFPGINQLSDDQIIRIAEGHWKVQNGDLDDFVDIDKTSGGPSGNKGPG